MPPRSITRVVSPALLGLAAGALFGAGDVTRALLREGSVLAGASLPATVYIHAGLGLLGGIVLGLGALPWRDAEAVPHAVILVGAPVLFVVLLLNVDWLPAFLAPASLIVDAIGLAVFGLGVWLLPRRLGPMKPVRVGLLAAGVIAASFGLPYVRPIVTDPRGDTLVDGDPWPAIVVVVVDTLRADALAAYGSDHGADPRLAKLASEGVVFENVRAASTWTKPSTASILTGLHPSVHGAVLHDQTLPADATTLAEMLKAAGYRTAAFSANPWVSPAFGFGQGFDRFEVRRPSPFMTGTLLGKAVSTLRLRFKNLLTGALYGGLAACDGFMPADGRTFDDEPSGDLLVERALNFVDDGSGRFFLYLHLMEPHSPYAPPKKIGARFDPGGHGPLPDRAPSYSGMLPWDEGEAMDPADLGRLRAAYAGEVAAADAAIGRLLDGLEERGVLRDCLVAVLSDHGEEFYEHRAWGHGHSLHEEVSRVPLLLRLPAAEHAGRRVKGAVSTVDLVPTLLDLLELRVLDATREPQGLSLAVAVRGEETVSADRVVFSEVMTATETLRLAATADRVLIRFEGRGDDGAVILPAGAGQDDLETALREAFEEFEGMALRSGKVRLGEEQRDQLEGIGYLK